MQNFVFHNPTKIIFGRDTIPAIGPETAAFGKNILLVYGGGSIKKNGIYDQVRTAFQEAGTTVHEHPGVRSNPVLSHVREGIRVAKQAGVEAVTAVGGGSVIDSAKAIAAGALVEHDVWKFFTGKKGVKQALPLTCVLTLAASGSEMNGGMVVTNEEKHHKFGTASKLLNPKVSILDPTATFSVPPDYTAYGAVDAIAHILEFYFTTPDPDTPVQDRLMEGLVINCRQSCERVLANPEDYQGRADLMWSATLALNGLTAAGLGGVGLPMHMIEHSLSGIYDVPHGAGLAVVIPGWLSWLARSSPEKISRFAGRVLGYTATDAGHQAETGIAALKEWFRRIGCPTTLADLRVPAADIPLIAENAAALAKIWRLREYTQDRIETILDLCR